MAVKTLRQHIYNYDYYSYGFAYNEPTSLKDWLNSEIAIWCFDTFGDEGERWLCATGVGGHGYAFRNEEDAIAFKLRWM